MSVSVEDTKMRGTSEDGTGASNSLAKPPHMSNETIHVTGFDNHPYPTQHQHQHRGSTSTFTSESTDSSPTTTISTADSSSITDPSPSSSPESPVTIVSLSSFTSRGFGVQSSEEFPMSPPLSPFTGYHGPLSPGKKARNTKNLSLNVTAPSKQAQSRPLQIKTVATNDPSQPQSAPPSPSFIVPPRPQRKRPSNLGLTIKTPTCGTLADPDLNRLKVVPPTPSGIRSNVLRHHQSSPSLSLFSPAPDRGTNTFRPPFHAQAVAGSVPRPLHPPSLPHRPSADSISPISEHASPLATASLGELEEEDDFEIPLSQEQKSPAYPSGPVCIYDPLVYLYLEPDAVEASEFDVIFNVAREVQNPFSRSVQTSGRDAASKVRTEGKGPGLISDDEIPEPGTATSVSSFQTAFEFSPSDTTPKATSAREPEYVHIPWDHNTNIVDDLLHLVEEIDDRVQRGKKVLIHCQCGVSRSASLIVAYGLYKNPSLTVQEAYDAVKKRSRWIGPNMSLIYQLSEFRTKLVKSLGLPQSGVRPGRGLPGIMGLMSSGRANTISNGSPASRPVLSTTNASNQSAEEPQSAPLPDSRDRTPLRSNSLCPQTPSTAVAAGKDVHDITPGPSSAPSGLSWLPEASATPPRNCSWDSGKAKVGLIPPPLPSTAAHREPWKDTICEEPPAPSLFSPRAMEITANPFEQLVAPVAGTAHAAHSPPRSEEREEVPPTPSLFSPRALEIKANPFEQSIASPTAITTFGFGIPPPASKPTTDDPRSPPHRGDAPITRNILDVL